MTEKINALKLKIKLAERQITQSELADAIGVSPQSIHRALKGNAISLKIIGKIADYLGLSIEELILQQ